jgi:hypothetical protein
MKTCPWVYFNIVHRAGIEPAKLGLGESCWNLLKFA